MAKIAFIDICCFLNKYFDKKKEVFLWEAMHNETFNDGIWIIFLPLGKLYFMARIMYLYKYKKKSDIQATKNWILNLLQDTLKQEIMEGKTEKKTNQNWKYT